MCETELVQDGMHVFGGLCSIDGCHEVGVCLAGSGDRWCCRAICDSATIEDKPITIKVVERQLRRSLACAASTKPVRCKGEGIDGKERRYLSRRRSFDLPGGKLRASVRRENGNFQVLVRHKYMATFLRHKQTV
jgi:hypothetical protein